jgi:type IV secretion system protein VirB6/type IV secretion system protein TrbL
MRAAAGKAGRIAADATANLARGAMEVAKAKASSIKEAAMDRIAETTSGKIAAAIKAHGQDARGSETTTPQQAAGPTFGDNSLAAANSREADPESEVAAFRDRDKRNDSTA